MVNSRSFSYRCHGYLASCKRAVGLAKIIMVCCFLGRFTLISHFRERTGVCERRVGYDNPVSAWFIGRDNRSNLV